MHKWCVSNLLERNEKTTTREKVITAACKRAMGGAIITPTAAFMIIVIVSEGIGVEKARRRRTGGYRAEKGAERRAARDDARGD
jgi:hypothetical protein